MINANNTISDPLLGKAHPCLANGLSKSHKKNVSLATVSLKTYHGTHDVEQGKNTLPVDNTFRRDRRIRTNVDESDEVGLGTSLKLSFE
jgi:hypothetical protein